MQKLVVTGLAISIIVLLTGCGSLSEFSPMDMLQDLIGGSDSAEEVDSSPGELPTDEIPPGIDMDIPGLPGNNVEEEEMGLVDRDFYFLSGAADLIEGFSVFEYRYTRIHPNEDTHLLNRFSYEGSDTVSGVPAERIRLDLSEYGSYDVWIDAEGNTIQFALDGEILEEEADFRRAGTAYNSFVVPYAMIIMNWQPALVSYDHQEFMGWELVSRVSGTRDFGRGPVRVDTFDFLTADGDRRYFELTAVGEEMVYVGCQAGGEVFHEFRVLEMIPR